MILEVAILHVRPGQGGAFERAFAQARTLIASAKGCISHELWRCAERVDQYLLLVRWETRDDHVVGFRQSPRYEEWRRLLHHFYEPFPRVEHYDAVGSVPAEEQA